MPAGSEHCLRLRCRSLLRRTSSERKFAILRRGPVGSFAILLGLTQSRSSNGARARPMRKSCSWGELPTTSFDQPRSESLGSILHSEDARAKATEPSFPRVVTSVFVVLGAGAIGGKSCPILCVHHGVV